jgi:hypothetical protein
MRLALPVTATSTASLFVRIGLETVLVFLKPFFLSEQQPACLISDLLHLIFKTVLRSTKVTHQIFNRECLHITEHLNRNNDLVEPRWYNMQKLLNHTGIIKGLTE